ncbi:MULTISPECIES: DUF3137 domain-containing protein [Microbacterium]|uniref:DUF3137 domain-containing protein n=1 Tax=Microbacterium TaxID=33882 RepID=UPI00141FBA5E|nr:MULTISPECIES: DUF3137 domain-containing protein [Microbacterium]NIG64511.1 hypothetical protein [Microbacterium sp. Be9]
MPTLLEGESAPHADERVPGGLALIGSSLATVGIAAVIAFYLLPVGFGLTGATLVLAQVAAMLLCAAIVASSTIAVRRHHRHRAALAAVAETLGWEFRTDIGDRVWGGSIDEQIDRGARTARDHLDARHAALPFDSIERTFVVGDREGATMHTVRAVRIPLPSEAPRITLRSRRGGGALSVLPRRPTGASRIRLEGDFSDVFEVSVPAGYETDALYVLTPDLMVVLLDQSADLDLEIIDSTLHVYFPAVDLTDDEELRDFLAVIAALYDRFGRRTMLYRDEAAEPLDPASYRRDGDTLADRARGVDTRVRWWPVLLAVATPLVPMLIAVVWLHFVG